MTLDEAIIHAKEMAEDQDMKAGFETDNQAYAMSEAERKECKECADEHRQLAKWLKELRVYRKMYRKEHDEIKALEQEPCEDAVTRQEVEEKMRDSLMKMEGKDVKAIVEITMDAWESEHSPIVNGEMTVWENGEPVTKHILLFNALAENGGKE